MISKRPNRLRFEVDEAIVDRLLAQSAVCAADFHCLDCTSKKCLWKLCLKNCFRHTYKEEKKRRIRLT
jgi:hypothetical protein